MKEYAFYSELGTKKLSDIKKKFWIWKRNFFNMHLFLISITPLILFSDLFQLFSIFCFDVEICFTLTI